MKKISGVFVFLCGLIIGNSIYQLIQDNIGNEFLFVIIFSLAIVGLVINLLNFLES